MSNHIGPIVRVVVCAANINKLGQIVIGIRHHDKLMNRAINKLEENHGRLIWEQGFVDQYGVYMSRQEAMLVATEAGQINTRRTKTAPYNLLYSEDLY